MASHDREDEYAEAFRRGYERARRSAEPTVPLDRGSVPSERLDRDYPVDADATGDPVGDSRVDEGWDEREFWGLDLFRPRDDQDDDGPPNGEQSYVEREVPASPSPAPDTTNPRTTRNRAAASPGSEARSRHRPSPPGTRPRPGPSTGPRPRTSPARRSDDERRRTALAVGVLAAVALMLVGAAFGLGRLLADGGGGADGARDTASAPKDAPNGGEGKAEGEARAQRYTGPVDSVTVAGSTASCQSGSSVDSAGNPVTYDPARAHDSDLSTAWRCPGSGEGQRFTVTLGQATGVAEVGLVPGYAKTDPVSGADRYAENNRLTKVRWVFDDGTSYVQKMDGDPADRSMRTMRIPETSTSTVVIEILGVSPGPRNTVAISEIRLAAPST